MLSALASEPGRVFSPDELARHAWGVRYHAIRHRSRLVVTIKRLRDTLGGDAITAVAGGYRLSVPTWTVLEPVNATD
jgi:DNA-binding response OmpR family regulator